MKNQLQAVTIPVLQPEKMKQGVRIWSQKESTDASAPRPQNSQVDNAASLEVGLMPHTVFVGTTRYSSVFPFLGCPGTSEQRTGDTIKKLTPSGDSVCL